MFDLIFYSKFFVVKINNKVKRLKILKWLKILNCYVENGATIPVEYHKNINLHKNPQSNDNRVFDPKFKYFHLISVTR